jgi:predicted permease
METLVQDVRFAVRMLVKNAGFTAVAVMTLALGIGANTAIFTLVNALLLKTLPIKDPQQLVVVGDPARVNGRSMGTPRTDIFSYPLYKELRDQNSVFTGLSASATDHHIELDATKLGGSPNEQVVGRMVSGNFFSVLGVNAAAGRLLTDEDDTVESGNPLVVLGYDYWKRGFALSPAVIGKDIRLNGFPFTVVGVSQPGFGGDVVGEEMQIFLPLSMQPAIIRGRHWRSEPSTSWLSLLGRLKPGISAAQAKANLNVILQQAVKGSYGASLSADDRGAFADGLIKPINVAPGGKGVSELRRSYEKPLMLLMGVVALVLLIACVNVANLLLARASGRSREIAVRLAIGASRKRLIQQLLTESILLALLGGLAGFLVSIWGVRLLVRMFDSNASLPLSPDLRVLTFTTGICVATGILFGFVPALRTLKFDLVPTLKSATTTASEARSSFAWGKSLVAGQVALSLLVLFCAGLLVRSLQKLLTQDIGYDPTHVLTARLDPTATGYKGDKMKALAQQLVTRISALPGVQGVTYSENGLFSGSQSAEKIVVPGFTSTAQSDQVAAEDSVGPDYFSVVGIPILAGRGIGAQDTTTSTRVAVINETFVKHFFHGENPVGRQFVMDDPEWRDKPYTIVGVSRDAKDHELRGAVDPRFYYAFQQWPEPHQVLLEAEVSGPLSAAISAMGSAIKATDPNLSMRPVSSLQESIKNDVGDQIATAELSAFFAGLALILACIGLYGVMSYTVAARTREIGVRMALGAQKTDVLSLVVRESVRLVAIGVLIGIPISLGSSRLLNTMLYGLKSWDPSSLLVVTVILSSVAFLAGYIPARRAARIDPMVALRYE